MKDQTDKIRMAIMAAQIEWLNVNWTHLIWYDNTIHVWRAPPSSANSTHGSACLGCIDTILAAQVAEEALESLTIRDYASVVTALTKAVGIERKWGDVPTWEPVLRLATVTMRL